MATYNSSVLESQASNLNIRAVFAVIGRVFIWGMGYSALHSISVVVAALFHTLITTVSLGRVRYPTEINTNAYIAGLIFWSFIGLLFGLGKAQALRVEAQTILCEVEQEKHLKKLAEMTERMAWTQRQ